MENYKFDKATREKLASLSSRELESVLGEIAEAIGADKMKTRMLLGNVEGVKGMLRTMTDDEANKLINSIGGEKVDKILKDLKERY